MSYRTAILIDRYVKTFSDSENQPQRTTTVQYNSSLISGDDTMSEITTAAIGNYPTHSIPDAVSSPFSIEAIGANGSHITTDLERQTNLQSTHRVTIGGVTYVRVPYRYGYVVNSNGKKYIELVQSGDERFVWHSNLDEEAVEGFDLESYLENVWDWTRLDTVPEGLRGTFIYTEDTEDWTPDDENEYPENYSEGRVWPALKIFTDEDFKAVYESDDSHYYFLVEHNGMDVLIGNLALVDDEYIYDGTSNQFLKGELLPEPVDAAIMNEGQEEIVSVDMKFGDEWYRVAGTDEVIHVIIPEQQSNTSWHIILGGGNVQLVKSVKEIATYLGDTEYSELSSAREYVEANSDASSGTCEYPRTITNQEKENLEAAISSEEVTIYGNCHFVPEGGIEVQDDGNEYEIHMSGAKLSIIKMVRYIAQTLEDTTYDDLGEANTYVTDNSTVDESDVYHCVYPNTVSSVEKASLEYSIGDYMESSGSSTYSYEFVLVENSNPSGEATEYNISLSGAKLDVIKVIRNIATQRGDADYDGLTEAKDYVDANGTVNSSTGICTATYPNTIQASERDGISALIDSLKTGDEPQIAESLTYTFIAV